jgi:hypothetical protein
MKVVETDRQENTTNIDEQETSFGPYTQWELKHCKSAEWSKP